MSDKKNISIEVQSSKSLMNRGLICQSYNQDITLAGETQAEDVDFLRTCLHLLKSSSSNDFYCGDGGTTLRFFALRASRESGNFHLTGSQRLFQRPQNEIIFLAEQLGFKARFDTGLSIESRGWQDPQRPIKVSQELSSQFVSSVLLNSWSLNFDLTLEISESRASESYLVMTLAFMKDLGFQFQREGARIFVPKNQRPFSKKISIEPDMSSSFFVAALASDHHSIELRNFPERSLQPDGIFTSLLRTMGYAVELNSNLTVQKPKTLQPVSLDLTQNPDIFPVLALLCARADGISRLTGLTNLKHKESDRLQKITDLLVGLGVSVQLGAGQITIEGRPQGFYPRQISFDPDQDHRLVMAALVAKSLGAKIDISTLDPVKKSFPQLFALKNEMSL